MANDYLNELEGPLATAVQAAWNRRLPQDQIDQAATRVINQLNPAEVAMATQPASTLRSVDRSGIGFARWLVWTSIAAAILAGAFFAGKYTTDRSEVAVVANDREDLNRQPAKPQPGESVNTTEVSPSAAGSRQVQNMGFIPGISLQAIRRTGSADPTDVILFGKGPSENVTLGQGFALDSPFVRALGEDIRITPERLGGNPDGALAVQDLFVHFFEPRVSPRSQVLTQNKIAGPFVVSPDGRWIVTRNGLQIEIATGKAVQLPGDWSLVKRVQFAGPDRLVLGRSEAARTGVDVGRLEVLDFPSMEKLREFDHNVLDSLLTTLDTCQSFDHAVGILTAKQTVHIYDTDSDQPVAELQTKMKDTLWAMAISDDRQWIATSSSGFGDGQLSIHTAATGEMKQQLSSVSKLSTMSPIRVLAFSPDSKYLAAAETQNLVVYDVATGQVVRKFPGTSHSIDQVFWSAESSSMTTVTRSFVQNHQDGREESVYPYLSHWSF